MIYDKDIEKTRKILEEIVKREEECVAIMNIVIEMIKILEDEKAYVLNELWEQNNHMKEVWVILEWKAKDSMIQIMIDQQYGFYNLCDDIEKYAELVNKKISCEFSTVLIVEKILKKFPNIMVEGTKDSKSQDYTLLIVF